MPLFARFSPSNAITVLGVAGLLLALEACSGSGNGSGKLFAPDLSGDASTGPDRAGDAGAADASTDGTVPAEIGECGIGKKTCNAACVANDDPATGCTAAGCTPCSVPHAVAGCVSGACGVGTCEADYGDCDQGTSGCETNITTNPAHCGACGNKCASGDVCSAGTCQHSCGNGLTTCGGSCVNLATDTDNCGGCGMKCPGNPSGSPTCKNFQCGIACGAGYHLCNGVCASDQSVSSCGSSCIACPTPFNGTATCNGATCGVSCSPGSHACSNQCWLNTSVSSCGSSCTACPTPANGNAACDGVSCGVACFTGYHACGGVCVTSSVTSCGTSCTPCTAAPANAQPICTGTACDFSCNPGYARSGAGCIVAPLPVLSVSPTVTGKTTGTFTLTAAQASDRLGGTCPNATLNTSTSKSAYQYVTITNPTLQTATVTIWTSLAPTPMAQTIDTVMATYATPPVTDADRKACVKGVADECSETSDPTICLNSSAALYGANQATVLPLGSITVYVASYFGTTSQNSFGDYALTVRTDALQ